MVLEHPLTQMAKEQAEANIVAHSVFGRRLDEMRILLLLPLLLAVVAADLARVNAFLFSLLLIYL
jgi:hypothetical protein